MSRTMEREMEADSGRRQRGIRVLVVDDSAIVRSILAETLAECPDVEWVGTAPDAQIARNKVLIDKPDVLTLDLEMPGVDGLTFLRQLMRHHPLPVVVISSLAQNHCEPAMEALRLGAVDVLPKPGGPYSVSNLKQDLVRKVRAAAQARLRTEAPPPVAYQAPAPQFGQSSFVVAIGASTGGVQAIEAVLQRLPENSPGVVVAQHIPAVFSTTFAKRLDTVCAMQVKEAEEGDRLVRGRVLIAPGNRHLMLRRVSDGYRATLSDGPPVCFQRPSVDVLFESVASAAGSAAIGVILTGMGADGADGLLKMKQAGAHTIAQNEGSCVVFGMPKKAIEKGAVSEVLPLCDIGQALQMGLRR